LGRPGGASTAAALALLTLLARAGDAQYRRATELSAGGLGALASRPFAGAGLGLARRWGQLRPALTAAGGSWDGRAALRIELTAQYLVNPGATSGATLYAAFGVAGQFAEGTQGRAYLAAWLGLESAGRSGGPYAELGVGGGVRLAAGLRWRWLARRR
jgi:hypothetical protein